MALKQDIPDLIAFVGDDWDPIPWQLSPTGDITGWTLVFSLVDPTTGLVIFTTAATMSGAGTAITTGLCFFKPLAAQTALIAMNPRSPVQNFAFAVERTDSGFYKHLSFGVLPVRPQKP